MALEVASQTRRFGVTQPTGQQGEVLAVRGWDGQVVLVPMDHTKRVDERPTESITRAQRRRRGRVEPARVLQSSQGVERVRRAQSWVFTSISDLERLHEVLDVHQGAGTVLRADGPGLHKLLDLELTHATQAVDVERL